MCFHIIHYRLINFITNSWNISGFCLRSRSQRHSYIKSRPHTKFTGYGNFPIMDRDILFGHQQANPRTNYLCVYNIVTSVELTKQFTLRRFTDPHTIILDTQYPLIRFSYKRYLNTSTGGRILHRIGKQIINHSFKHACIGLYPIIFRRQIS